MVFFLLRHCQGLVVSQQAGHLKCTRIASRRRTGAHANCTFYDSRERTKCDHSHLLRSSELKQF